MRTATTFPPNPARPSGSDIFVRAALAIMRAGRRGDLDRMLGALRDAGHDDAASLALTRAAVSPGMVTGEGWGANLARTAVADFIGGLGPVSAAAQLAAASLQVDLGASTFVPGLPVTANLFASVEEGAPIPVVGATLSGGFVNEHKIGVIISMSKETLKRSDAETMVRTVLAEAVGVSLDAVMLGTHAGTMAVSAGLRYGAITIDAYPGADDVAMTEDITALAAAVAPVAGSRIVFVTAPRQAVKLALRTPRELPYPVLASGALPDGTVMAVAVGALATAIAPSPDFYVSNTTLLHMNDEPLPIADGGTVAAPTRSLWQTDSVGFRAILGVSWALRAPGAVAVISGASW